MQTRRAVVRRHGGARHRLAVTGALACFVVAVYVGVVLGGGGLVGHTDSPSLWLSVAATAAVALLFAPAQAAIERIASRVGHPAAATPYDVLSRFSEAVTGGYGTGELPAGMSKVLAEGTGAQWAQVWLQVSGRLTLAATWPADARADVRPPSPEADGVDSTGVGRRAEGVRHGGRSLGVLRLQERPGMPLTGVEQRLMAGLAAQAGLVLRLAALRAELEDRHAELVSRAGDLQASRDRLIAAHDAERRRLERDIHDGAQQHLVALAVNLRLAQTISGRSPERAADLLAEQADAAPGGDRHADLAVPRDLSNPAQGGGSGAGPAVRGGHQLDPGDHRHHHDRTAAGGGGGGPVLLLHGGGAERREAFRCAQRVGAARRPDRPVAPLRCG